MSKQCQFIRQTAAVLMAFGLFVSLLPSFAAAQDESTADNEWGPGYSVTPQGLRIDGIIPNNPTNRIIYDNDMFFEDPGWLILSAMHKLGRVNLRGIIVTYEPNPQGWLLGGLKSWPGAQVADYNQMRMHAIGNGLSMMPHTLGAGAILVRPSSGNISDTRYTSSPGSRLIIEQAEASTPSNPLIVYVGGQATTVANALLERPDIANRMIVIYAAGIPRNYNTYDGWATYVVVMRAPVIELGNCWADVRVVGYTPTWSFSSWPVTPSFSNHLNARFRYHGYCDVAMLPWLLDQSLFTGAQRRTVTGLSLNVPITHPTGGSETINVQDVSTSPYGHLFIPRSSRAVARIHDSWYNYVGAPAVWAMGSLPPAPATAPAAPSHLVARGVSSSRIDLEWIDNSSNEYGFWIDYHIGHGRWGTVGYVEANITTFSHNIDFRTYPDLNANTTYSYRVRAENTRGASAWTAVVSARTTTGSTPPAAPAAPSALVASAASSSRIDLEWNDNSNNETRFRIERRIGSTGTWSLLDNIGADTSSYANTGLSASTTYGYRVRAENSAGNSVWTTASATTAAVSTPPPPSDGMLGLENASGTRPQANSLDASRFVAGSSFLADTLHARFTSTSATGTMRMAIYADSGSNSPGAILGGTAGFDIGPGLRSAALKDAVEITEGNVYWIATWVQRDSTTNVTFVANDGAGTRYRAEPAYSATASFPSGSSLSHSANVTYAVYASGTED